MVKRFESSDYEMLCSWWKARDMGTIPLNCLSSTGLIVNNCVAGFLYLTNSKMSMIDCVISDKESNKEVRQNALDILVDELTKLAKEYDYKCVFFTSKHPRICDIHKNWDYNFVDANFNAYIRSI